YGIGHNSGQQPGYLWKNEPPAGGSRVTGRRQTEWASHSASRKLDKLQANGMMLTEGKSLARSGTEPALFCRPLSLFSSQALSLEQGRRRLLVRSLRLNLLLNAPNFFPQRGKTLFKVAHRQLVQGLTDRDYTMRLRSNFIPVHS